VVTRNTIPLGRTKTGAKPGFIIWPDFSFIAPFDCDKGGIQSFRKVRVTL
jgi:hypothetical protein